MKNNPESEGGSPVEKTSKPYASLVWGLPGHEKEYVLQLRKNKFGDVQETPIGWGERFSYFLGKDWCVLDRGSRIEIMPPDLKRTAEADSRLTSALRSMIGPNYEFDGIK